MPYLARDLRTLDCPLDPKNKTTLEQLQNLPIVGKEVDFKYDYQDNKAKYPSVQFVNLASNSPTPPKGEGHGVKERTQHDEPDTQFDNQGF